LHILFPSFHARQRCSQPTYLLDMRSRMALRSSAFSSHLSSTMLLAMLCVVLSTSVVGAADDVTEAAEDSAATSFSTRGGALNRRGSRMECPAVPPVPEHWRRFAETSCIFPKVPADLVWETVIALEEWSNWNDVFEVIYRSKPPVVNSTDKEEWFDIQSYFRTAPPLLQNSTVPMQLTVFDPENRLICWDPQGFVGLEGRHCLWASPCNFDATMLHNFEDHTGWASGAIHDLMSEHTTNGFNRFNRNMTTLFGLPECGAMKI